MWKREGEIADWGKRHFSSFTTPLLVSQNTLPNTNKDPKLLHHHPSKLFPTFCSHKSFIEATSCSLILCKATTTLPNPSSHPLPLFAFFHPAEETSHESDGNIALSSPLCSPEIHFRHVRMSNPFSWNASKPILTIAYARRLLVSLLFAYPWKTNKRIANKEPIQS